jgi:purine-binding chemotaxis protein CheW
MSSFQSEIAGKADAAASALFGVVRVGVLHLALSIEAIREVVPYPRRLVPLPSTLSQLRGAIELRGAIVPVLDMAEVLGHGEAVGERPGIILVARGNSRVIGFGVHEICGVIAIDGDRRTVLDVTEGGVLANSGIVSAAFSTAGHSGVILDVDALASLPGVPLAEDRLVSSQARRDLEGRC